MASTVPAPSYREASRSLAFAAIAAIQRWHAWLALAAVTAVALGFNAWGLAQTGYGNTYYAAGVRSMTESWHNFFFVAFDPGGFISIDKPPVFLWIDALSARIFGYSTLSLLLPSAIAGAGSVALLWLIVRRYFGVFAATIAGLVLALTPISVAVNRLNLPEPFLLLALIGAAGCILRSLDSKSWLWWTIGAGLLVGVAFNTKMLVAWVPGPALAIALVIGIRGDWWKAWQDWIPRLAVFGTVALIASVSWMLVVDNWPGDRPYVSGSRDNSVYDLMLVYNGVDRVDGGDGFGGSNAPTRPGALSSPSLSGAGGIIAGESGPLRMFDEANGGQIAWFLPYALIGGALSIWRWRSDHVLRAAVMLWLGWALLYATVFSFTEGIYHSYYTSALAPGVAALSGISSLALVDLIGRQRRWLLAAVGVIGVTLYAQLVISGRFDAFFEWATPLSAAVVVAGLGVLAIATFNRRLPLMAGVGLAVAGLLLVPSAWSSYEATHASTNATLPQAGPRNGGAASGSFGSLAFDAGVPALAAWLKANNETGARWDLVVISAQNASTLMAAHGLSVMALGGFSGADPTLTVGEFSDHVADGDVRYVLVPGGMRAPETIGSRPPLSSIPGDPDATTGPTLRSLRDSGFTGRIGATSAGAHVVMQAVLNACVPVRDSSLPLRYLGGIYDCAGKGVNARDS